MQKTESLTYRQFTARFMKSMKQNRQKVLSALESSTNTEEFIIKMLRGKDYAFEYANEMQQNKGFNGTFKTLRRKVCSEISQSEYEKVIDYLAEDLQNKFLSADQNPNQMQLIVSKIVSAVRTVSNNKNQDMYDPFQKEEMQENQHNNQKEDDQEWEVVEDQKDSWVHEKPYQPRADNLLNVSVIPKGRINQKQIQKSAIKKNHIEQKCFLKNDQQKVLSIGKNQSILNAPQQTEAIKRVFNTSDLIVQVRYLNTFVDYERYKSNGFGLKDKMEKYIRKYLGNNQVIVRRQIPEIKIMEEIDFVKSKQAGNYRFNPFFDVLQIWIKLKNNSNFNYDFTIEGDINKLPIIGVAIEPHEWNKTFMKLTPKSTVEELVKYVCEKRQATPQLLNLLIKGLKEIGGADIAQDLFGWERSDFANMKIKPTYIFQIQELIEQIKDSSNIVSEKAIDKERQLCIKAATSHKILRYVVFKAQGQEGVRKISWLNMENLLKAHEIVRNQIHNEELLDQLEDYFSQFALDPEGQPIAFSRGNILYGPPGTGKTVLTQALPNIIGFHLIEKGLSAADFMKSLVGQTSRMIKDLVNRAAISPWLLCSIGIDEVDGLVPDRKDKDEKNKGEGISIMLSVIGGNKDVPNLIYMTSTNYIKKIDEAIGRRLNGKYQVGRPNPNERKMIIQKRVDYLKGKEELMSHLIRITSNFTGAALGGLANILLKSLKIKKMRRQVQQLTIHELTEAAITSAKQFNITFGVFTLPQIYRSQCEKKFIFTETFLKRISNHFLLVQNFKENQFRIMYANEIQKFYQGRLTPIYEQEEDKISIGTRNGNSFQAFVNYVRLIFEGKKYDIRCFGSSDYKNKYNKYSDDINEFLAKRQKNLNKKTVLIIEDHPDSPGDIKFNAKLFQRNHINLYMIYYILPGYDISTFSDTLFGPQNNRIQEMKSVETENYSGRIMVELNDETRMAFQLKNCMEMESKVAFRLFLKSEESNTPKTVIPELVDFFTKQQASYLLLIDYELLLQNDAFEEKKILEVMEEKMLEAKSYKRSAVLIDLDSLILLNENASDSNFGRSMSYSIQNYNLYQILLSYMRSFASTTGDDSRWLTMIAKHPELIKMVKKQLSWPKYPEQIEKQIEETALDEEKRCFRCNAFYNERQNKQERKCMQHPGRIIDTVTKAFENLSVPQLKAQMLCTKKKDDKPEDNRYVFACCMKGLNEQGENAYYHITEEQFETEEDELAFDKITSVDKWNKVLTYFHL